MSTALPETEITLLSGERVMMKPWSLGLGRLMRKRIAEIYQKLSSAGEQTMDMNAVLQVCEDEIYQIVRDTLDWDNERMDEIAYEDLLTLAQGVIDVCLIRKDGGGVAGKLLGLAGRLGVGPQLAASLDPKLQARMEAVREMARKEALPSETSDLPEPSPSSPADGEPTPND